jgi:hypothetical protein
MPLVFQYGSNTLESRLNAANRLRGHADDRGAACTVDDYDIAFDVWSQTNRCAASDLIRTPGRKAWGVLYEIAEEFIQELCRIEGKRYAQTTIRVLNREGQEVDAMTFLVRENQRITNTATSFEYVSCIVQGLRDHGAPNEYVEHVIAVAVENTECAGNAATEQTQLIKALSKQLD